MRALGRRLVALVIVGLVVAIVAASGVAHAQTKDPLIAILEPGPASPPSPAIGWMTEALGKVGWVDGRTARIETRFGDWRPERIEAMLRELIALKPDVIYTHSTMAAQVVSRATTSIPVVVAVASDLVEIGVVRSLAQPGGNVTSLSLVMHDLDRKRFEVLREAVPSASRIADLVVPGTIREVALHAVDESARLLAVRLRRITVRTPAEIEPAFNVMAKERVQAVFVRDSAMLATHVGGGAALTLRHRLPSMSQIPGFADPGDLPVEQPTKIELVVNLKTAKALGVTIPPALMVRADRVIR